MLGVYGGKGPPRFPNNFCSGAAAFNNMSPSSVSLASLSLAFLSFPFLSFPLPFPSLHFPFLSFPFAFCSSFSVSPCPSPSPFMHCLSCTHCAQPRHATCARQASKQASTQLGQGVPRTHPRDAAPFFFKISLHTLRKQTTSRQKLHRSIKNPHSEAEVEYSPKAL